MSLVQDPSTGTAANIKGPSTAPTTTDAAMVVSISPNCTVTTSATAPTDRVASGTITALNANVPISAAGIGDVGVTITGTWSATLTFQGTIDASNWFTVQAMPLPVTQTSTTSSSTTTNGQFTVPLAGLNQFRVTATAFSSGTVTVTLEGNESAATTTGIHTVQQGTAANLQATATQGPAASLSGAWPTEITDGTHGPAAVKAASTGAAAADPSLVVALSPNSPLPTGANVVGAVTQSGGPWTVSGTVTVTQTTPSNLQGEVAGLAAAGSAPVGNPVQIGGSDGTNIRTLLTDTSGRQEVVGAAASGAAVAGNPVLIAGSDGTDARSISTDASGHPVIVGDGTAGSPAGGVVSVQGVAGGTAIPVSGTVTASGTVTSNQGTANTVANAWPTEITDGTHGPAAVKAASTAAAAADPSLVIALSPNSPLPTGANVVGAVTQSGAWTTTVTQATPANLQAEVGGLAAAGSVPVGNPVQIGGSDGTDIRTLATDASGHPVIVGDGTAGSPAGGVVSVQGVVGGQSLPVSGSVTASGTVTSNQGTANTVANAWPTEITDGTHGPAAVKAASTAAAAADPSLVIALSPNSPLPTGANVVGAVTQSGAWTATVTQATPANLQAEVGGLGAAGAALVGNPVQIGGSDGTDTRTLLTDSTGRQIMVGAAADGAAFVGNPVLIGGQDGTDAQALLTDTLGRLVTAGAGTAGTPAGGVFSVQGVSGGQVIPISGTTTANQGTPNTLANAWPVEITDGTHGPVAIKAASTAAVAVDVSAVVALSPNSPLYDNFGNPIAVKNRVQMPSTQGVTPISGLDVGVLNRLIRVGEVGSVRTTSETQLWHDAFEGSTVNAFWTQSTTTQTIAQATGVLTLNNSGITTVNTDSIITSQRQFPKYPKVALHARYKANISANVAANHTLVEFGFGAPAGVTAVISNGCFFRMTAAGNLVGVTSYNGTENVSATLLAQGSINTTSYYRYDIFVEDQFARFIVTDANDIPVVDFQLQIPLTAPNMWAVSHLPTFARVYVDATGGGTVVKLLLSGHDVQLMDILTNKPWNVQLASQMRNASINPTTYAQTASSMTAAPATETPSNTVGGYNALGGDFATALTVASENPLSVFGFQIPSPYTFYLTMMQWSVPFVSTTIGVTGVPVLEWLIIANCASGDIATGGGQKFPVGLNMVYTGATQAAGSLLTIGGNLVWNPDVPVTCLPGTFLHIAYKVFITSAAATPGVTRGSVYVDGYFE